MLGPDISADSNKASEYRFSLADMLLSLGNKLEAEHELMRGLAAAPASPRAHATIMLKRLWNQCLTVARLAIALQVAAGGARPPGQLRAASIHALRRQS